MMNSKKTLLALTLSAFSLISCTHNNVSTHRVNDAELNCAQIKEEMKKTEEVKDDIESKRGMSGRNVGMALIFWPGIIVNEVNGSDAITAANKRMEVLSHLYSQKQCAITVAQKPTEESKTEDSKES